MYLNRWFPLSCVMLIASAVPSFAQVGESTLPIASRGVVIAAGGFSVGSGTSAGAFGLTATFGLTERLALEANGAFTMSHSGMDTQSVTGSLLVNLLPARETRIVPYVTGGLGLYRADFDMDRMGFVGFMNQYSGYSGMMALPNGGFGMMNLSTGFYVRGDPVYAPDVPMFYGNRLGMLTPARGRFGMRSFTDPAVSYGAGVQIRVGEHLVVRPDGRAITAIANGDRRTVAVVTIGLGYGF